VHLAAKTTSLVAQGVPDGENPAPKRPMGLYPKKHSHSVIKHAMCKIVLGFRS
jgi:hypothetical protein